MTEPENTYVEYDFDPRNLPQEHPAAIGLVVASASHTEHVLSVAIAGCARVDTEFGGAITTHMATPLKISVLKSLATIRLSAPHVDELDNLLSEIDAAIGKRNTRAHGGWCRHAGTNEV